MNATIEEIRDALKQELSEVRKNAYINANKIAARYDDFLVVNYIGRDHAVLGLLKEGAERKLDDSSKIQFGTDFRIQYEEDMFDIDSPKKLKSSTGTCGTFEVTDEDMQARKYSAYGRMIAEGAFAEIAEEIEKVCEAGNTYRVKYEATCK